MLLLGKVLSQNCLSCNLIFKKSYGLHDSKSMRSYYYRGVPFHIQLLKRGLGWEWMLPKALSMQVNWVTTRGRSSGICTLPWWQWITRELHSSLTGLLLFNVTSAKPASAPLSREHHSVLHFLPHSRWACCKHTEGRLHLDWGELSDLPILLSFFFPE